MPLDSASLRAQFPLLRASDAAGRPITYLDGAATAQKPQIVLNAVRGYWETSNANVHRSQHPLSEAATAAYEGARERIARFVGAASPREVVVTRGTTEGINLVARSYGALLSPGERVLVTRLEHHANVIPWLQLSVERGVTVEWIGVAEDGLPDMAQLERELARGDVRVVAVTGQSNVLGTRPDIARISRMAHAAGAVVVADAAQLAVHGEIDVRGLGCDFLAFSGHKLYGPDGVGVLYGRAELLERMPPFLGGGMMLEEVTDEGFTPAEIPAKFEAGTPPASGLIGLAAAVDWLEAIPAADRIAHEHAMIARLHASLSGLPGVRVLGPADPLSVHGCVSFTVEGAHPHDIAHLLGEEGICVRAGHHCARPLHRSLGIVASVRASVSVHTTMEEIDLLAPAVQRARARLRGA